MRFEVSAEVSVFASLRAGTPRPPRRKGHAVRNGKTGDLGGRLSVLKSLDRGRLGRLWATTRMRSPACVGVRARVRARSGFKYPKPPKLNDFNGVSIP